jgi:hypothetical protein
MTALPVKVYAISELSYVTPLGTVPEGWPATWFTHLLAPAPMPPRRSKTSPFVGYRAAVVMDDMAGAAVVGDAVDA